MSLWLHGAGYPNIDEAFTFAVPSTTGRTGRLGERWLRRVRFLTFHPGPGRGISSQTYVVLVYTRYMIDMLKVLYHSALRLQLPARSRVYARLWVATWWRPITKTLVSERGRSGTLELGRYKKRSNRPSHARCATAQATEAIAIVAPNVRLKFEH